MKAINKKVGLQRGIGLLELMLALAIIAVLLIMATRYYQSTSQAQKVNQAASDIQAIIAAAANYRAGNPSGEIANIAALKGFLPSTWGDATTANPWGGPYTATGAAANPTAITISVSNMPTDACDALATLTTVNTVDNTKPGCAGGTMTGEYGANVGQ